MQVSGGFGDAPGVAVGVECSSGSEVRVSQELVGLGALAVGEAGAGRSSFVANLLQHRFELAVSGGASGPVLVTGPSSPEVEDTLRVVPRGLSARVRMVDFGDPYLQGLLVQSGERRNAENLAEAVPASPRALQRFLTESPWDDDRVIGRLQEYLGPRLEHPEAVWVLDGSDFPKQGGKSAGVARQYCGSLGKIANCQAGVFLAHVGPKGRVLVDKRLYLPEEWTGDVERCVAAGVPEARREYRGLTVSRSLRPGNRSGTYTRVRPRVLPYRTTLLLNSKNP